MKVKVFDAEDERDLEDLINRFINNIEVIDIKYSVSNMMFEEEQIYSYSALIMYKGE